MMDLYRVLPGIIIKVCDEVKFGCHTKANVVSQGIPQCTRAVISQTKEGDQELLVEGEGLQKVMTTDG